MTVPDFITMSIVMAIPAASSIGFDPVLIVIVSASTAPSLSSGDRDVARPGVKEYTEDYSYFPRRARWLLIMNTIWLY